MSTAIQTEWIVSARTVERRIACDSPVDAAEELAAAVFDAPRGVVRVERADGADDDATVPAEGATYIAIVRGVKMRERLTVREVMHGAQR